jgi:hypothetical protein
MEGKKLKQTQCVHIIVIIRDELHTDPLHAPFQGEEEILQRQDPQHRRTLLLGSARMKHSRRGEFFFFWVTITCQKYKWSMAQVWLVPLPVVPQNMVAEPRICRFLPLALPRR